jgi:hypothetical protein
VKGGEKLNREFATQVAALVVIISFVCFAGGYAIAGGITKQTEQYTYSENISVNVKIENLGINSQVQLCKGMTPFDALLKVASLNTVYYESFGASIVTEIGGIQQSWTYRVNGVEPSVGMQDYQLRDGDNLELVMASW